MLPQAITPCVLLSGINCSVVVWNVYDSLAERKQATYGRYSNALQKKDSKFELRRDQPIPAKLAWFLMESPNLVIGSAIFMLAALQGTSTHFGWLVACLFMLHYVIRTLVFSVLLRGSKPMPLMIVLQGGLFTMVNGSVQTYHHLFELEKQGESNSSIQVLVGLAVFALGFFMNQLSDHQLRTLRKNDGDVGYYIPRGWFFEYLSAPNLMGEVVEWIGFAIVANTFVAWCFAVSTACLLSSRALGHHTWYLNKFGSDYPAQRKAIIPFVF